VRQSGRTRRRRNGVEAGPQGFQDLPGTNGGARDECADETVETIVLVAMHVEVINRPLYGEACRQFVSDPVDKVDDVLTYDVIYEHDALVDRDADDLQATKQSKVDILLLFPLQQIDQGIWDKTPMPRTTDCYDAGEIASLGGKQCILNCSERVFTRCFLPFGIGIGITSSVRDSASASMANTHREFLNRFGEEPEIIISLGEHPSSVD
jgi:uncharacterized protein (DUF924 family)